MFALLLVIITFLLLVDHKMKKKKKQGQKERRKRKKTVFVDPLFSRASPLDGETHCLLSENHLKNGLESPLIFLLF